MSYHEFCLLELNLAINPIPDGLGNICLYSLQACMTKFLDPVDTSRFLFKIGQPYLFVPLVPPPPLPLSLLPTPHPHPHPVYAREIPLSVYYVLYSLYMSACGSLITV